MRLRSVRIQNYPPIRKFEAAELADVVVLAGRNGVGKSKITEALIGLFYQNTPSATGSIEVEPTSEYERTHWGSRTLNTAIPQDAALLHGAIAQNRFRANWTGSILRFESDRSIQNISNYAFQWDVPDPDTEQIGWNQTIEPLKSRYQDTIHAIYRKVQSQKNKVYEEAERLRATGNQSMRIDYPDPLEKFKEVFNQLLGPKVLVEADLRTQQILYMDGDQKLPLSSLSSGEREAVNIAFDFLLRSPSDCIVFFDEPEIHLHPELTYRLLTTLRNIGARNQFILCTHSPDVITASLDQSVIFVAPKESSPDNQAIPVTDSDGTSKALALLGQSVGVIALGRKIVLIEGSATSLDKQTYGLISKRRFPGLVLVPSGGKGIIQSFHAVHREVLSRSIWGVDFFMLCDGDALPREKKEAIELKAQGRLRVLPRYHLENYFLDEHVLATVFASLEPTDSWLVRPDAIRKTLRELAKDFIPYAVALDCATLVREQCGNVDLMPRDCQSKSLNELVDMFIDKANSESDRLTATLNVTNLRAILDKRWQELAAWVTSDDERWKHEIPGKPLLAQFASKAGLQQARLKKAYVDASLAASHDPFDEIFQIMSSFSEMQ